MEPHPEPPEISVLSTAPNVVTQSADKPFDQNGFVSFNRIATDEDDHSGLKKEN